MWPIKEIGPPNKAALPASASIMSGKVFSTGQILRRRTRGKVQLGRIEAEESQGNSECKEVTRRRVRHV